MELDNIKDLWNEEKPTETPEISTEQQQEIHNPLQKIRKNMRMEFWFTILTMIFIIPILYIGIENLKLKTYTLLLLLVMVGVTAFYFKKFFMLYKELGNVSVNTKDSLKDLMHQFELNKQYYYSYYLSFAPFMVCEMILLNEFRFVATPLGDEPQQIREIAASLLFVVSSIFGLFFLYAVAKWWFQNYYGKYIDNVVMLNSQINGGFESQIEKIKKRRNSLYARTDRFLGSKFGKFGSYLNTTIWVLIFMLISFALIFIIGVIIGFSMAHFGS